MYIEMVIKLSPVLKKIRLYPVELYNFANDKLEIEHLLDDPTAAGILTDFRLELKSRTTAQTKTTGYSGE